jgi:DNA mismatch repair protein MutS2
VEELLAEAEGAERAAAGDREAARRELREAEAARARLEERERELESETESVRAGAARAREEAVRDVERDLAAARAELASLREEIRAARRRESERRRAAARPASRPERERDRRLGKASERAARAEQALRAVDEPPLPAGPLAAGDPVVAADLGVRGTIASVEGDEAEVVGPGGLRVRIALDRLRPDSRPREQAEQPAPPVRVVAAADGQAADELDVRGRPAQEAREAVRAFVDEAALAGLPLVRVVHGRGTGVVRSAVREELRRHELVERHEADSADGATVVHLAR